MKNKKLEEKLIKAGYSIWVQIIEACEEDEGVKQITVDKNGGFTELPVLNKMIETYLKKLKVKLIFSDMSKEMARLKAQKTTTKSPCKHVVHAPFKKRLDVESKKQIYMNYKYPIIRIEEKSYVICPECSDIIEIKDE